MSKKKTIFLSLSVLDVIFRIAMWVIIVYFVIKGATRCYDLGYRVFTEDPIAPEGYGRDVQVEIPVDFTAKVLGELFESKGLSRDSLLFALQYYASEYREGVKGGTYVFSTEQTAEEMFEQIAAVTEAKEMEEAAMGEELLPGAEENIESPAEGEGTDTEGGDEVTPAN
jgi:UPF0755 protein